MCVTRGAYFHDGLPLVVMLLTIFCGFYNAMMETYFVGCLYLPPFNGPNEGNLMISSLGVITYTYGLMTIFFFGKIFRYNILEYGDFLPWSLSP
jgi:hypothetical protein